MKVKGSSKYLMFSWRFKNMGILLARKMQKPGAIMKTEHSTPPAGSGILGSIIYIYIYIKTNFTSIAACLWDVRIKKTILVNSQTIVFLISSE